MKLTSRERLRRCYFNEEIDRPGVYCRMYISDSDRSYEPLRALLAAKSDMKYDWSGHPFLPLYPSSMTVESYSDVFERRRTVLPTPKGKLFSTYLVGLKGQPGYQEKYLLESREDAEKYLSLPLAEVNGDVSSFFDLENQIGDHGIVSVGLRLNPAGFVAELFGTENFAMMSIIERDILHQLMERQMKIILRLLKFILSQGVGPFFNMGGEEYIVPPIHGPKDFYDFNVMYDKPIIDCIHNAGGRIHIHCHGSIKSVLADFVKMGVDVLHPFEAPPLGDIKPREAKGIIRGKMCMEGNIQIADMYEQSSEDIKTQVSALIEAVFDDHKGLIVCPTASPYVYGKGEECFENYKMLIDTVLEYAG